MYIKAWDCIYEGRKFGLKSGSGVPIQENK